VSEKRRTRLSDFGGIPADPVSEGNGAFHLDVYAAHEVLELPDPPPDWALLGPLVYRGNRTIIVGDTGHGKTSLALQMLGAIVAGRDMLGYKGAQRGPALILDLEQGVRSIKRGLREAQLDRDDVLCVSVPDGLALDREADHVAELDRVLTKYRPVVVLLDPYYKAHRAEDPNAERPIIDLMRKLDGLRAIYDFALILPAHPRKDVAGKNAQRRLTIHDVAGSGAVTRGAEIVLGIERLNPGAARLRFLKDRDGDLEVGEAVTLAFSKEHGFRITGKSGQSMTHDDIRAAITTDADPETWRTLTDWRLRLGVSESRAYVALDELMKDGLVESVTGPEGRRADAKCFRPIASSRSSSSKQARKIQAVLDELPHPPDHPVGVGGEEGRTAVEDNPFFTDLA